MWLVVGGRGHVDQCVSVAGASGQMGMPTQRWGWLEEVPVLREDQVQLRPAESEWPTRQPGDVLVRQLESWAWNSRERPRLQAESWGLAGI